MIPKHTFGLKALEPQEPVEVVFRAERGRFGTIVTAVFPRLPWNERLQPGVATCYAHLGQHGACSLGWYRTTKLATEAEYAPLKAELERQGYTLKIRKRASAWARRDR